MTASTQAQPAVGHGRPSLVPGLLAAALVAAFATALAPLLPILGAPVIAIVAGVALRSALPLAPILRPGIAFCARSVLQAAIVVSGLGVSLVTVYRTGLGTLPVTLATMAIALTLAPIAGRLLGIAVRLRELIGIGTAICGASAIAAVAAVTLPTEAETGLAVATIFCFNIVAVLTFPLVGHALGLSQAQFGVWAGTAINDTSSVVAAGFAYGHAAGVEATIVKLTRATLILPVVGVLALLRARSEREAGKPIPWKAIVPWFIVWFLVAALVDSAGLVPENWHTPIAATATFLISAALAAIGLQTAPAALFRAGARPLALGLVLWLAVAASSLAVQRLTGR